MAGTESVIHNLIEVGGNRIRITDLIVAITAAKAIEISTDAANQPIVARTADQGVATCVSGELVVDSYAIQQIITSTPQQCFVAGIDPQQIVERAAVQHMIARQPIGAIGRIGKAAKLIIAGRAADPQAMQQLPVAPQLTIGKTELLAPVD